MSKYHVFISYSHSQADRDWAQRLANALSEMGLRVWYDETEIKPGDPFVERLEEGLRESEYVVFVTPEILSNWAAVELGAALALRKPLIPIVAEDMLLENIPGPIRRRKYLPQGDPLAIAGEIAATVASEAKGNGKVRG
ncbi:MAG: hypothetical protein A2Z04_03690 [Chloroflexi bacterium RBG_16_57_9]|nr:MAG: hypothetical protein A2Z04_03690 [Chloroflexi bacterium RBG_16_57_9]